MSNNTKPARRGCVYWLRLFAFAAVTFVILGHIGYLAAWAANMTQSGHTDPCCITPLDLGHPYQEVSFSGGDALTLKGWYIPSQNGAAVILIHGYAENRAQMLDRADMLARHGYGVLLYDLRAHGQSDGDARTMGWADLRDVPGALDYVASQPDVDSNRIGVLGFSVGGQIALRAAAQHPEIAAVVAEEPSFVRISDLPSDPRLEEKYTTFLYWAALPLITLKTGEPMPPGILDVLPDLGERPVLYLTSGPPSEYTHLLIAHFYEHTSGPADLWNVPEASHGTIPVMRPEEYEDRIVSFFDASLLDS